MQILYEIGCIEGILNALSKQVMCGTQRMKNTIAEGKHSIANIKALLTKVADCLTLHAYRHMNAESYRPFDTLSKTKSRCSKRHVQNVKKRKFETLKDSIVRSSVHDLVQAGSLERPEDVCELIHGDYSKAYKKKRACIIKSLSQLGMRAEQSLRNMYTKHKKFLTGTGPPLQQTFGARRPPIMQAALFLL